MKSRIFCLVTHAALSGDKDIAGPAHNIAAYLKRNNIPYIFIRHSIYKDGKTLVSQNIKGTGKEKLTRSAFGFNEVLIRLREGYLTIASVLKIDGNQELVYVGIDPLNSFWGVILRWLGKINKLIVFSADYSLSKYKNKLINTIYYFFDKLTVKSADLVLAVSPRILTMRKKQGIPDSKLICMSNSPAISLVKRYRKKFVNPQNLIMVGGLPENINYSYLLLTIYNLRKYFPQIKLTIIGIGPGEKEIRRLTGELKLGTNITVRKPMSHEKVFRLIGKNGLGIALYTNVDSYRYFSDSMKARDYMALGLPVIISGDLWTAEEISREKAGIVIKPTEKELSDALKLFLNNNRLYQQYRQNALNLAEKRDSEKILDYLLTKLD